MPQDRILVRGAREHNLKDITVAFPRDRLIVITGLSGSGKSSLAFDTIYAEGQRRYVESLSAYARQFLGQMEKPDVDAIDGLSPAISIDQKGASRNPRSTVGTVTEIYDHLRLLFARIGHPHCPNGHEIERQSVQQIVDQVLALPEGTPARRPRAAHQGPQDRGRPGLRGRPPPGLRPRPGGRRDDGPRRHAAARPVQAPHDRGRRRPLRRPSRRGARGRAARPGDGPAAGREGRADPRPGRHRLADSVETALRLGEGIVVIAPVPRDGEEPQFEERRYSREVHLPVRRVHDGRARAAQLQLQLAPRRLPGVRGSRVAPRDRSGPARPGQGQEPPPGRAPAVGDAADGGVLALEDHRGDLQGPRLGLRHPGPRPAARGDGLPPARAEGRAGRHRLPPRTRREHVHGDLRGRSSATSSGATARPNRSTSRPSSRSSWSRGRARPAAARSSSRVRGREDRQAQHQRRRRAVGHRGPRLGDRPAGAHQRSGADDRPPAAQGDRRPARLPRRRRAGLPDDRPDERHPVGR